VDFFIREMQTPEDYAGVARLLNQILSEPTTADRLQSDDTKIPKVGKLSTDNDGRLIGYDRIKLVAQTPEGFLIGLGIAWRAPWTGAGVLYHTLVVDSEYRRRGIGAAIYERLHQWSVQVGADTLIYMVNDSEPDSIRFAEVQGYFVERHSFESTLNLNGFHKPELYEVIHQVKSQGIQLHTLAEMPGESSELQLYELSILTSPDIPGYAESAPPFSEWKKWSLELEGFSPERVLIAVDTERFVGYVNLVENSETGGWYHEYTCVHSQYRGRHIALALKLWAIQIALHADVPYLRTHNDSANKPMLHINRDILGFRAEPGQYRMRRNIPL
jgi:GNAT superfamily N-acetyltransferase